MSNIELPQKYCLYTFGNKNVTLPVKGLMVSTVRFRCLTGGRQLFHWLIIVLKIEF